VLALGGVLRAQFGKAEYVVLRRSGRAGGDEWLSRRGARRTSDLLFRFRLFSGILRVERFEDATLRFHGERIGSWGRGGSLLGFQYRSQVSVSVCKAARSASEGLRGRESSNEVSELDELKGSNIMPGFELCDEIERRFWSVSDVTWHAFVSLSSVLGLK